MRPLAPVDLASGIPLGAAPVELPAVAGDAVAALRAAVLPALCRPPCLVSFSGGRDSSLVLAVATMTAREAGVPDPIPATIRASDAPLADESDWQEQVVRHLALSDWLRLSFTDELDVLGPVATTALRRHGLLWPFNSHFHAPLLDAARRGTLLTGIGGDELFRAAVWSRTSAVLGRRVRAQPRDALRVASALAPQGLRRRWVARRHPARSPWLSCSGRTAVTAALAAHAASEPRRLEPRLRWARGLRYLEVGTGSLDRLAGDAGCALTHPLLDTAVWAAVAAAAAPHGFADRTAVMRELFGGLLPDGVLAREGKASFDEVFFHRHSRAFVRDWDGGGLPPGLVDAGALRAHWLQGDPAAQSFTLLQAAWLAAGSGAERADQLLGGEGERVPGARTAQSQDGE